MKQIDWTSGRVPAMAVDSGCRIAATIQELEEAMKGGLSDGTIAYCKEDSSMYVLTEKADGTKAFEKISNWVDNEEVIDMFEEYTGEKPKVSIDTTKTARLPRKRRWMTSRTCSRSKERRNESCNVSPPEDVPQLLVEELRVPFRCCR